MIMSYRNGERLLTSVVNDKWECAAKNYSWVNSKITFDHVGHAYLALFQVVGEKYYIYTIRREMKCNGDSEILHGLVHDITQISP